MSLSEAADLFSWMYLLLFINVMLIADIVFY